MEKREPSYTVGGNVNWCSHCEKQQLKTKNKKKPKPKKKLKFTKSGKAVSSRKEAMKEERAF